jgi:FixJ family two-component response regulator
VIGVFVDVRPAPLEQNVERPVIFITGFGDVPTSVRAMKAGAIDFLTKPVSDDQLLEAIARATERDAEARTRDRELQSINALLRKLTPREHQVLTHIIAGRLNKQIAHDLGTVVNTIKVHRSRVMEKLGVRSVAELTRAAQRAGIRPANVRR